MNVTKATPGPWKVYHENGSMGSGGHWGIESASSDPLFQRTLAVMSQNSHLSGVEASANASRIVTAVNLHDEVVASLRKLEDTLTYLIEAGRINWPIDDAPVIWGDLDQAREILMRCDYGR